jgi:hypothetical protein
MMPERKPLVNLRPVVLACALGLTLWLTFGLVLFYYIW